MSDTTKNAQPIPAPSTTDPGEFHVPIKLLMFPDGSWRVVHAETGQRLTFSGAVAAGWALGQMAGQPLKLKLMFDDPVVERVQA